MGDESSASIPPELRVVLDLELTLEGANTAADHQKLQDTLSGVPGVDSVSFSEGKVAIQYEPEEVTKARLSELLAGAGFRISGADCATPAPSVDSQ